MSKQTEKIKYEIIQFGNKIVNSEMSLNKKRQTIQEIDEMISLLYTFKHTIEKGVKK